MELVKYRQALCFPAILFGAYSLAYLCSSQGFIMWVPISKQKDKLLNSLCLHFFIFEMRVIGLMS